MGIESDIVKQLKREETEKSVETSSEETLMDSPTESLEFSDLENANQNQLTFKQLLDNANDFIQSVDSKGYFKFVNKKWKKAMGYSDEEIKKLHFTDVLRADCVSHCEMIFKKLSQGESFTNIDVVFKTKSGQDIFLNGNLNADIIDGKLVSTYGIFRDMTERKKAFESLKKNEKKLREIEKILKETQKIAKIGRWDYVHSENRLSWTETIDDIFEIDPNHFDVTYEAFFSVIHPDDRDKVNHAWAQSVRTKKSFHIEHRLLVKDNRIKWVREDCTTTFDDKGNPLHSIGIVQDITDQKQIENMTQTILDGSSMPQFVIDKEHRIIQWNQALEKYSGIKAKDVIGTTQHWRAFYDHERSCLADLLIDGKTDGIHTLYENKSKNSRLIDGAIEVIDFFPNIREGAWLYFTAAPIHDANGNVSGVVETLIDITDQKQTEEMLVEERKRLDFILDVTNTRIDIIDPEYTIQYVDKGWQKIYGDPSGRKCYEYFMDRSSPCVNCGIPKALEKNDIIVTEETLSKEDDRLIEVHTIPFQDSNGHWLVAEINIDITERKKIEKEMERQVNTIQLLNQIISKGYSAKDTLSYLQETLTVLLCTLAYDGGSVALLDSDGKTASVVCSKHIPEPFLDHMKKIIIDDNSMYTKLFRENETIVVDNFATINPELARILGYNSFIISPIVSDGMVVGGLHLVSSHVHGFTESDSILMKSVTSHMGTIIKNFRSEERVLEKLNELEHWKKVTVGREIRMKELKKKIKELEGS